MKLCLMMLALGGCAVQASFDFTLSDGTVATSANAAQGSVNNAGFLTLSDTDWTLTMNLVGLQAGNHAISSGSGDLQIVRAATGDTFVASLGGTCNVWLNAHGVSNGSPVTGTFTCSGLTSTTGKQVDVSAGSFQAPIDDPANDPIKK